MGWTAAATTAVDLSATTCAHPLPPSTSILNFPQFPLSPRRVLVVYLVMWHRCSFQKVSDIFLSPGLLHMSIPSYSRARWSPEFPKYSSRPSFGISSRASVYWSGSNTQPLWWLFFLPAGCQAQGAQRALVAPIICNGWIMLNKGEIFGNLSRRK